MEIQINFSLYFYWLPTHQLQIQIIVYFLEKPSLPKILCLRARRVKEICNAGVYIRHRYLKLTAQDVSHIEFEKVRITSPLS